MKNTLWFLLILFANCKSDEKISPNIDRIKAGIVGANNVYYDLDPDILQDTIFGNNNEMGYDLNADGIQDIALRSQKTDGNGRVYFAALFRPNIYQIPRFSINIVNLSFGQISSRKFITGGVGRHNFGSSIGPNIGVWTPLDSLFDDGRPLSIDWLTLAGVSANGRDTLATDPANNWRNIKDGYVGVRMLQGQDTLYGWIRVSVEGSTKITLHDCAFEKN